MGKYGEKSKQEKQEVKVSMAEDRRELGREIGAREKGEGTEKGG